MISAMEERNTMELGNSLKENFPGQGGSEGGQQWFGEGEGSTGAFQRDRSGSAEPLQQEG